MSLLKISDAKLLDEEYIYKSINEDIRFSFHNQSIVYDGFLSIKEAAKLLDIRLMHFDVANDIKFDSRKVLQRGPNLYSESTLISKLSDLGIGRPSTYSIICPLLKTRNYINKDDSALYPTSLGRFICREMNAFADFFDLQFTVNMEKELNLICNGQRTCFDFLKSCSDKMVLYLNKYKEHVQNVPSFKVLEKACFVCGSDYTIKLGRFGPYAVCNKQHKHSLGEEILSYFFFSDAASVNLKSLYKKSIFKTNVLDSENHFMNYDGKVLFCSICKVKREADSFFVYHL